MDEAQLTKFMKASREGKLSTRDRRFINSFSLSPIEQLAANSSELATAPSDLAELSSILSTNINSEVRKLLEEEKANVESLIRDSAVQNYNTKPVSTLDTVINQISSLFSSTGK